MQTSDISGMRFGKLLVSNDRVRVNGKIKWKCICDCGSTKLVRSDALVSGATQSCGCLHRKLMAQRMTTHGMSSLPEYKIWRSIISRCENKNNESYGSYGGRGITVSEEWRKSFLEFINDVGRRPTKSHSLERVDNNSGYRKENCVWATSLTQAANTRRSRKITCRGATKILAEWARESGRSSGVISYRIKSGWETEKAIFGSMPKANSKEYKKILLSGHEESRWQTISVPKKIESIIGRRFSRLKVVGYVGKKNKRHRWLCECDCGTKRIVSRLSLVAKSTRSCGCFRFQQIKKSSKTHGLSKTNEYKIWSGMKARCCDIRNTAYRTYGARGIRVCERWMSSFSDFIKDVGDRPSKNHSLDRIDNNGDYCPENCRWATKSQQSSNKRGLRIINHNGESRTMSEWSRIQGINVSTVCGRISRGWNEVRAITEKRFLRS
jgi:hypothetical protein